MNNKRILILGFVFILSQGWLSGEEYLQFNGGFNLSRKLTSDGVGVYASGGVGLIRYVDDEVTDRWNTFSAGIPIDPVNDHTLAPDGSVWLASYWGVYHFENGEFFLYDHTNSPLPEDWLECINVDNAGHVWIGTANSGLWMYLEIEGEWTLYDTTNSILDLNGIYTIECMSDSSVWVATSQSLFRYYQGEFAPVYHVHDDRPFGWPEDVMEDNQGRVWVAGGDMITIFSPEDTVAFDNQWTNPYIQNLYCDNEGQVWGWSGSNVYLFNGSDGWDPFYDLEGQGFRSTSILDMIQYGERYIFATQAGWIIKNGDDCEFFYPAETPMLSSWIGAMFNLDDGRVGMCTGHDFVAFDASVNAWQWLRNWGWIWGGDFDLFLADLNPVAGKLVVYQENLSLRVYNLEEPGVFIDTLASRPKALQLDDLGRLWLVLEGELWLWTETNSSSWSLLDDLGFTNLSADPVVLVRDATGNLLVAHQNRIIRFDVNSLTWEEFPSTGFIEDTIRLLKVSGNGDIIEAGTEHIQRYRDGIWSTLSAFSPGQVAQNMAVYEDMVVCLTDEGMIILQDGEETILNEANSRFTFGGGDYYRGQVAIDMNRNIWWSNYRSIYSGVVAYNEQDIVLSLGPDKGEDRKVEPRRFAVVEGYPNPFNSQLNVVIGSQFKEPREITFNLVDLRGRQVPEFQFKYRLEPGADNHYNLVFPPNLASGTYFVRTKVAGAGGAFAAIRVVFLK